MTTGCPSKTANNGSHDGSAPNLLAVVNHYNQHFGLHLTEAQKADLVEFLKSL